MLEGVATKGDRGLGTREKEEWQVGKGDGCRFARARGENQDGLGRESVEF